MSAGDFFDRWSRAKTPVPAPAEPGVTPAAADEAAAELPPPTLEDVAALGHDADFRRFVKPGVDESVRRSAMKKLFTDPHFNVMDGLDIYIGDYNTFEPMSAAMVAALVHGKALLDPLGHLQQPAMRMLDRLEQLADTQPATEAQDSAANAATASEAAVPETADRQEISQAIENPAVDQTGNHTGGVADQPVAAPLGTPSSKAVVTPEERATPEDDHTI